MTTKKIDSLPDSEWQRMFEFRNKCLTIARCTDPVDRPRAEKNFKEVYKVLLGENLEKIIWIDGPNDVVKVPEAKGENPNVWWGWDYNWTNYLHFLKDIPGVTVDPAMFAKLEAYLDLQHAHIWWSFDTCVVACERPTELHVDDKGRLHNPYGSALKYKNGYAVYALEGVRVPAKLVKSPNKYTIQDIRAERNTEIRRLSIKYGMGLINFLKETNARLLDSAKGGAEKLFEGENGTKFLICADGSTNRIYELTLPQTVATVAQAQAALSGMPSERMLERS